MSRRQHALRNFAFKLNVSGTAEVLDGQRLYKGGYGFIKLQVYAPKTQNTSAPVCSVFCTATDELGVETVSTKNYPLLYVGEFNLGGAGYLLFESLLPSEFTKKATVENGLVMTFNYCDTEETTDDDGNVIYDSDGIPLRHATDMLVSSRYITTVYAGGWNNEGVELEATSAAVAQIAENMRDIEELQEDVAGLKNIAERAEEAVASAEASAESAAQSVANLESIIEEATAAAIEGATIPAAESAAAAAQSAENAAISESNAAASAEAAATSESNAGTSAANASESEKAALTAAEAAALSAQEAVEAAETAGKSAYALAVENGFEGTEEEWLESLLPLECDYTPKEDSDPSYYLENTFLFGYDRFNRTPKVNDIFLSPYEQTNGDSYIVAWKVATADESAKCNSVTWVTTTGAAGTDGASITSITATVVT